MYEGLNEKQNQNHAISTSKNELFFVIVPKIVKSKKMQFFQFLSFDSKRKKCIWKHCPVRWPLPAGQLRAQERQYTISLTTVGTGAVNLNL